MSKEAQLLAIRGKSPLPRSGHKLVSDDKYIYLIGGYVQLNNHEENQVRGEIFSYHILTGKWEKLMFVNNEFNLAASHAAVKSGNYIFITGGTSVPFGVQILSRLILVNVKTFTQESFAFKPKNNLNANNPIATYGHSMIVVENGMWPPKLYIVGGTTGTTYHNQVYEVNLATLETEMIHDGSLTFPNAYQGDYSSYVGPTGRYKHEIFYFNDELYLVGGAIATDCCNLNEVHIFNLQTRSWNSLRAEGVDIPSIRCPAMSQNKQYVYLSGGLLIDDNSINTSIYQLDLINLQWSIIGQWSSNPTYFHDSCFVSELGQLFIFGGVSRFIPIQKRTNRLMSFQPETGRVINRSLQELAWQELYNSSIRPIMEFYDADSSVVSTIDLIGQLENQWRIPRQFIQRLSPFCDDLSLMNNGAA